MSEPSPKELQAIEMLTTSPGANFIFLAFCRAYAKRKGIDWKAAKEELKLSWLDAMVEYGKYLVKPDQESVN